MSSPSSLPHVHRSSSPGALTSRPIALAFRVLTVALAAAGIVRITGLATGAPDWTSFAFYTVQSNILCLLWGIALVVVTIRDLRRHGASGQSTPSARVSAAVAMVITVTMLVYLVLLVPEKFAQGNAEAPFTLTDNLVHIITPALMIADWFLFVPKGRVRAADPLLWDLVPASYLVFALTYGAAGGEFAPGERYPYPFLNVDELGVAGVAAWVLGLAVAITGVGYLYYGLDRVLTDRNRRRRPASL